MEKINNDGNIFKKQVVKSGAGRDKNIFFMVLEVKAPYVYLVDGKTRKLSKPKRKKIKHVFKTNNILDVDEKNLSDKRIRSLLHPFNY